MAGLSYCPRCLTTFRDGSATMCPNLSCGQEVPEEGWGEVLQPGDLIDRHYKIEKVLAVGGAGLTYLAREVDGTNEPTGPKLAVKVLYSARASGAYLRRLATEAQILQELDHDHIVQCRGFVHRTGHEPYLVTLFEDGGSLSRHLRRCGPLTPRVAAAVLKQILLGLDTAHQRGVVHRDLKPDNVLLDAEVGADEVPQIRVADFGIAKVSGGLGSKLTKLGAFVGTPEYAAPEQFEQRGATAATDVFACGGLFYFMLTGQAPIELSRRADIEQSFDELLDQLPPTVDAIQVPGATAEELEQLNAILANSMEVRPEHRWTAHQVIAALGPLTGDKPLKTTLEVTREPPPKRDHTPLGSQGPLAVPPKKDHGETQPFLIGSGGLDELDEAEEKETARMAPERVAAEEPTRSLDDLDAAAALVAGGAAEEEPTKSLEGLTPDADAEEPTKSMGGDQAAVVDEDEGIGLDDVAKGLAAGALVGGAVLGAAGAAAGALFGGDGEDDPGPEADDGEAEPAEAAPEPEEVVPESEEAAPEPEEPSLEEEAAAPPPPKPPEAPPKPPTEPPEAKVPKPETPPKKAPPEEPAPKKGRSLVGLLLTGMALFVVGSGVLAVGVVILAAVGLVAVDLPGLPGGGPEPFDPDNPVALVGSDRQAVQAALQDAVGKAGCSAEGPLVATVVVGEGGEVLEAELDPMYLKGAAESCVAKWLGEQELEGVGPGRARVALLLGE